MLFAEFFLEKTNQELGKNVRGFSDDVIRIFHHYNWPGNLRELNNVIKRSTLLTSGEVVEVAALPFEITHFEKLTFGKGIEAYFNRPAFFRLERDWRCGINREFGELLAEAQGSDLLGKFTVII